MVRADLPAWVSYNYAVEMDGQKWYVVKENVIHRHNLPAFTERMKSRLRNHCEDGHQPWPAKGRYTRHMAEISRRTREDNFAADVGAVRLTEAKGRRRPRLGLIDLDTGEINII